MKPFLKTKDYLVSHENFDLLYDEKLDMLITSPQPEILNTYYESEKYISHSDSKKTFLDKIYQLVKKYNLALKIRLLNKHQPEKKELLDIGAGTGDFLNEAKKNGWSSNGVEPNLKARKLACDKNIYLHENLTNLKGKQFEAITLWHVLEHLPDLNSQIKTITDLLTENGLLIIAVPNFKSFDAKYYKSFWAAFDTPRHLWHFSKKSIPLLFEKYGMKVINTKGMYFDSFYVSLLSEKHKTGKSNFIKALFIGLSSNIKALLTGEYSSIIYILKRA
ncbi:class I SAM-dependent methyltransferase [Maribacter sp. 2210JD10-5]|uniref:class I SAM-dependent methyltransferase n=1 Tax=Maribacter sp. 2210JD10-5 TaxID=3386272 RepID=UPI0039BCC74E